MLVYCVLLTFVCCFFTLIFVNVYILVFLSIIDYPAVPPSPYAILLKDPGIIDIVTVGETDYALVTEFRGVPGCTTLPVAHLASHLRDLITRGYSHRHRQPYRAVAGIFAWSLYTYSLETLDPIRKQTFSHALAGTSVRDGLLIRWGGQKLGRGSFLIPFDNESDVHAFFHRWGVPYTHEVIFRER
jgi:hypothetical protein